MSRERNGSGLLLGAMILGLIGGVITIVGSAGCVACIAWLDDVAEAIGEPELIPWWVYLLGASGIVAGAVGIIGAVFARRGGILPPLLLLLAAAGAIASFWVGANFMGVIGGVLGVVGAILGVVGMGQGTRRNN